MARKRTRKLTLVLLGTAGLMASGCGDKTVVQTGPAHPAAKLDEATAKRYVAIGTTAEVSEAFLHATSILASRPMAGLAAPLDLAKLGYLTDKAVETYEVASNNAQLKPRGLGGSDYQPRQNYHYHHGPGIGWMLFGYMLGRSFATPRYSPTPQPLNPTSGTRSGGGRATPTPGGGRSSTSGGVSRGGFGGSGGAHGTGGT
jgi:hypothetical protein